MLYIINNMCFNSKCNWCCKRKSNTIKIKIYCKWYNFIICEDCYDDKLLNNTNAKPKSKPFILIY